MGRLDGKIVLVTGGGKGQGPMHARLCAREGADVILVDILDDQGEATAEDLRREGCKARYLHLDITRGPTTGRRSWTRWPPSMDP